MEAVHKERLLELANFLDTVPEDRFDFDCYVGGDWKGAQDLGCGTTACALGWACTMPSFRALGARFNWRGVPTIDNCAPMEVAEQLFGVSYNEACFLFLPMSSGLGLHATAKQVAKHLRQFVDGVRSPQGWRPGFTSPYL